MTKKVYTNLDFNNIGQLLNVRTQNVTTAQRQALALTLDTSNEGLVVWDTTNKREYCWNGTQFVQQAEVNGSVVFKGTVDPTEQDGGDSQLEAVVGYEYVVIEAGFVTKPDVTFEPSSEVERGDRILFVSPTLAYIQQRNDVYASETVAGNVLLATDSDILNGIGESVVTSSAVGRLALVRQYNTSTAVTTETANGFSATINHGLNLRNKDSYQINVVVNGSQVQMDVDSVDADTLTISSLVSIAEVFVTVSGASA